MPQQNKVIINTYETKCPVCKHRFILTSDASNQVKFDGAMLLTVNYINCVWWFECEAHKRDCGKPIEEMV